MLLQLQIKYSHATAGLEQSSAGIHRPANQNLVFALTRMPVEDAIEIYYAYREIEGLSDEEAVNALLDSFRTSRARSAKCPPARPKGNLTRQPISVRSLSETLPIFQLHFRQQDKKGGMRKIHAGQASQRRCTLVLVDLKGFEPLTSSMPWKRAPNCATGPSPQAVTS